MKKKNIKIKHRKYSLYQRKKSKGRKLMHKKLKITLLHRLTGIAYCVRFVENR